MSQTHPGDSQVQRQAETAMLKWLGHVLQTDLQPRRLPVGDRYVEIDGVSESPAILVEAWAHQGPPKAAQKTKVTNDAFKLLAASSSFEHGARLILLFADDEAARPFQAGTWRAEALAQAQIEVVVAELPEDVRARIRSAQARQYR